MKKEREEGRGEKKRKGREKFASASATVVGGAVRDQCPFVRTGQNHSGNFHFDHGLPAFGWCGVGTTLQAGRHMVYICVVFSQRSLLAIVFNQTGLRREIGRTNSAKTKHIDHAHFV